MIRSAHQPRAPRTATWRWAARTVPSRRPCGRHPWPRGCPRCYRSAWGCQIRRPSAPRCCTRGCAAPRCPARKSRATTAGRSRVRGEGDHERIVPVGPAAARLMAAWLEERGTVPGRAFLGQRPGDGLRSETMPRSWRSPQTCSLNFPTEPELDPPGTRTGRSAFRWSEHVLLHLHVELAALLREAHLQQLVRLDGEPAQLIERTQQPRFREVRAASLAVPHLHGTPDELVPAGPLHGCRT